MMATITALDTLVGAHPVALGDLYATGTPADTFTLGDARGSILAFEASASTHAALRPLVVGLSRHLSPWRGKSFESGGTLGSNLLFGKRLAAFRGDVAPSLLDGEPTLRMRYDGLGLHWPFNRMLDELRQISPGVAIGPLLWRTGADSATPLLWWGLSTAR